jgi:hypothetical protein
VFSLPFHPILFKGFGILFKRRLKMDSNKSREKLKGFVHQEVTELFEKVLDFAEVAIATPETYKRFRSKVLRIGNNAIRNCHKELDMNYDVKWSPQVETEDVIEVTSR